MNREEYRQLMERLFVEKNVARVYVALVTIPQVSAPEHEAVRIAGELWKLLVDKYGHGGEPNFGDGQDG